MFNEFLRPASVKEAVMLKNSSPASAYIAGGTEVNSRGWCMRRPGAQVPDRAIGVAHLPLAAIEETESGVIIGANMVIQDLLDNPATPPLLAEAARHFANRTIRNMATLGGNIGTNKSCSNLIPSLLALDARVHLAAESGDTDLPLLEHIARPDPCALILKVSVSRARINAKWATRRHSRTANDISILSVSVTLFGDSSKIESPRVAMGGVAATVVRLLELEKQLDGQSLPSRDEIEAEVKRMVTPIDDLRGSARFKRHIAGVMVGWALHQALDRKGGRS
ncbi:MAG: FAD binding domain-containing protein [Candidatus Eremiobacteraeota bacterium]|nr:FAD binding domain-containing protein [Candidatus Eremiobacteraeota bacterium]